MRIAMVAGELSGDLLGARLIQAFRTRYPDALIEGIGGPEMLANGFHSHYPLATLSVMGLVEVVKHYRTIKQCYNHLCRYFSQSRPQVFIGIDAPDFNLRLEYFLKKQGIPTVHYVSPSVWAWRHYRLRKIARSCDLMLTLFPFEAHYYQQHQLPVKFVGHPLADDIPLTVDQNIARLSLKLSPENTWIALLPGSRYFEVNLLGPIFLQTAQWLLTRHPQLRFVAPMANEALFKLFSQQMTQVPTVPITLLHGQSRLAMAAADLVLTASGTATLEAMLLKRPMVVAYRLAPLTYWLAKKLVHTPYIALPNLLAQEKLVPEFLQDQVTAEQLGQALSQWLELPPDRLNNLQTQFTDYHQQLRQNASEQAVQAIANLLSFPHHCQRD